MFQPGRSEWKFHAVLFDPATAREARAVPAPTYQHTLHTRSSTVGGNAGSVQEAKPQFSQTKSRSPVAHSLKFPRSYERLRSVSVSRERKEAAVSPTYRHDEYASPTGLRNCAGVKGAVPNFSLPQYRSAIAPCSRFLRYPRSPLESVFRKGKAVRFQKEVTVY